MTVLDRLRGGLLVSVQAEAGSPLETSEAIVLLARVAERNGAAGLRIEGLERLRAVRAVLSLPVVGILKRMHDGFEPYITSTLDEVWDVARTGADIVAFDATRRPRADGTSVAELANAVHAARALAMADCSSVEDAHAAIAAGCDLIATTLAGYTAETRGHSLPALDIVAALRTAHPFVVCEGGISTPQQAEAAFAAGASAIVVGSALTNLDARIRDFVASTSR